MGVYSPPILHTHTRFYMDESHKGGPKILARNFDLKISWISLGLKNY